MAELQSTAVRPAGGHMVYHLADIRLGGVFPFLGQAGAGHRRQVGETFVRAMDRALELSPSFVLITGNLFGSPSPSREVADLARGQFVRLTQRGIPVLIAAGPLDALHEKTYATGALADLERVIVFPATPRFVEVSSDVGVVGASWSGAPPTSPGADVLEALAAYRAPRYIIGATYLERPRTEDGQAALRRQIAASDAAYLALGGWPTRRDLSSGHVPAWCPGPPELVLPVEGEGSPLVVRFDGGNVEVRPVPVAVTRFARFTFQPSLYHSHEELSDAIHALGDRHLAARIAFTEVSRIDQFIDATALRDRLAAAFLALDIVDESVPAIDALDEAAYPELSVAGKFAVLMRGELEHASTADARRRAGAALRLGLALLEGRRPA